MKILITEMIWDEGIKELEELGFEVDYEESLWKERERLLIKIKEYDALIVRNQTNVNQELLSAGHKIKVIGRLGVGLDNIVLHAAKEKGIKVVFGRHANATSVAEYVMAAILTANRPLYFADADIRKGGWDRKQYTGEEIYQKTIGLVGMGEISHRVAKRAKAFGMKVVGYDPFVTEYDHIVSETDVDQLDSLQQLLQISDVVSLHIPLNSATKHLISLRELETMKTRACLINTSRGGIIDEEALAYALKNQLIAQAYLDVLEVEPVSPSNPLLSCKNAVLTPHIAGLTNESQVRTSRLVAKEVGKILKGKVSLCTV